MQKSLKSIEPFVPLLEESAERVLEDWTAQPVVQELLVRWRLTPEDFIDRFGRGIYTHLIEVMKRRREPGDCPSLRKLLGFLADRQVSVGDVFALCMRLRHQVGEAVYQARFKGGDIDAYRAFGSALHRVFDANLRGVLDHYYSTLEQKDRKIEQMAAENESKDRLLHLQAREATMGEMIGAIAHQWKQPLNVLDLNAQELLMQAEEGVQVESKEVQEVGSLIRQQVRYMSRTIDDFRRFLQPVDEASCFRLKEAVDDVMELVGRQYHNHGIEIRFEASSDPELSGMRNDFVQVLLILLSNAKDAIMERAKTGRVTIALHLKPDRAVVTFCDSGGGIPEDLIRDLFAPYITTKESGTGIGLYIAKRIIERMAGTITVENREEGACFTLDLPCRGEEGCLAG